MVAANRDEFYKRPTANADFWPHSSSRQILAGRDIVAGGTWLGITRTGRFAAVTNIRDPSQLEDKPKSRGELPLNFLQGSDSALKYCESLKSSFDQYAGFNLLISDGEQMLYVNNLEEELQTLKPGLYGLSNGLLNSDWPKVNKGRLALGALLDEEELLDTDHLIHMMANREPAAENVLPDTGVPKELERVLSSAFILNDKRQYGTRCSTAIISSQDGETRFSEQTYDDKGERASRNFFRFQKSTL